MGTGVLNFSWFGENQQVQKPHLEIEGKEQQDQWSDGAKAEVAMNYFTESFQSSNPKPYDPAFENFIPKVSDAMNATLMRRVSNDEVKEALFSINADSAPGPDGMTGTSFQKYWGIIGGQVTKEIQEVFETEVMPKEWNLTYLCLIPKIPNPEHMTDMRPISLCSVLYKTVA